LVDGIPIDNDTAFRAWLDRRDYVAWPQEPSLHPSKGPHPNDVRVYFSPKLASSLRANQLDHPKGAAAVEELYTNGVLSGWGGAVKTQADSAGGKGWYWYEVTSVAPNAPSTGLGNDDACRSCHSSGGRDFVQSLPP
jgi:hypothetical protein